MRSTFDLSPLYRTAIGFERLSQLFDAASRQDDSALAYPPYNIEQVDENHYRITMAVAGFGRDEIDVTVQEGKLTIKSLAKPGSQAEGRFLHRGIASRAFERTFQLADHVEVANATLENGLLHVDLARRVPEEKKPRKIAIRGGGAEPKVIEGQAEAA